MPGKSPKITAGTRTVQDNAGFEMRLRASMASLEAILNTVLACNNKGMVFASDLSAPGRDMDGCIPTGGAISGEYELVEEEVRTALPGSCRDDGSKCKINLDLAAYSDKKNVSVTASCDPARDGWCRGPITGTGAIPNMDVDYSAKILRAHSGDKNCNIIASYTAATKQLQLRADYSGGSTSVTNKKYCSVRDISVAYKVTKIKQVQ